MTDDRTRPFPIIHDLMEEAEGNGHSTQTDPLDSWTTVASGGVPSNLTKPLPDVGHLAETEDSTGVQTEIREKACRGCEICVDICPLDVFTFDEENHLAVVSKPQNCIACLSCSYRCPSGAISLSNYHQVKNFYRDLESSKRLEKFL